MLARNYQPQFQNYHRLTGTNKVYVTGVAKLRRSESLGLWMVLAKVGVAGLASDSALAQRAIEGE
jgi:hypothetical protein